MSIDSYCITEELDESFKTFTKTVGVTRNNERNVPIQRILSRLSSTAVLTFKAEPSNPYDPNAIKIYADDIHIGYINKELASNISYFLKLHPNFVLTGRIVQITGGEGRNYGCNIEIWFCTIEQLSLQKRKNKSNNGVIAWWVYGIVMLILFIVMCNTKDFFALVGLLLLTITVSMVGLAIVFIINGKL